MRVENEAEGSNNGSLDQADPGLVLTIVDGDVAIVHEGYPSIEHAELPRRWIGPSDVHRQRAARVRLRLQVGRLATDTLCLTLALAVARWQITSTAPSWSRLAVPSLAIAWLGILGMFGLNRVDVAHRLGAGDEGRRILGAVGVAAITVLLMFGDTLAAEGRIPLALLALAVSELGVRAAWRSFMDRLSMSGSMVARAVVIGTLDRTEGSGSVDEPGSGLTIIGHVEIDGERTRSDAPTLGRLKELPEIVRERAPDLLLANAADLSRAELDEVRRVARVEGLDLHIGVTVPETLRSGLDVRSFGSFASVRVHRAKLTGARAALKRGLDIAIASVTLVVAAPFIAVIALAVAVTSPGPVFFKQVRVTKGLRTFTIYKFRTMVRDVDALIDERSLDKSTPFFKPREEDLITGVGRFLRRTSLDELPQAWNVLRGDMSLVGPRPLPVEQVDANPELLEPRHDVRAGVTGWWQVSGRSDVEPEHAVRKDMFYIENWSLALDVSILVKTFIVLLHRRGAY
jgi:exopolysaccharide biosynthesis polyprenyl glycosylphosphotransferase